MKEIDIEKNTMDDQVALHVYNEMMFFVFSKQMSFIEKKCTSFSNPLSKAVSVDSTNIP